MKMSKYLTVRRHGEYYMDNRSDESVEIEYGEESFEAKRAEVIKNLLILFFSLAGWLLFCWGVVTIESMYYFMLLGLGLPVMAIFSLVFFFVMLSYPSAKAPLIISFSYIISFGIFHGLWFAK